MLREKIIVIKENEEKIKPGNILRNLREKKHLTLKDISKAIKIHPDIISALEHDNYERIKNTTYIRGYLRLYAHFLKLPDNEILELFERLKVVEQTEILPKADEKIAVDRSYLLNHKKIIIIFISVSFLLLLGYLAFHHGAKSQTSQMPSAKATKSSTDPATAPISILPPPVQDGSQ